MKKTFKIIYLLTFVFLLMMVGCKEPDDNQQKKLDTPSDILVTYNQTTNSVKVSFKKIEHATIYTIYFYKNNELYKSFDGQPEIQISSLPEGEYQVKVRAVDETNEYSLSDLSTEEKTIVIKKIEKVKLIAPTNISAFYDQEQKEVVITFTEVQNAKSYLIYIYQNNVEIKRQAISNNERIKLDDGEYEVKIQSISDNELYLDSDLSNVSNKIIVKNEVIINDHFPSSISFLGLENETVSYGSNLHALSNIRVIGNDNATYVVNITYSSSITLINDCIPSDYIGEVIFHYEASYLDLKATGTKKVIVLDPSGNEEGDNLIINGDFEKDASSWEISNHEGASSEVTVDDGTLKVAIYALNQSNASSPRLNSNKFTLENGVNYIVSFDAWANSGKAIQVQIGELFSTSPYFINYMGDNKEVFILDTNRKNYTFTFKYDELTSNNATILFEMGIVTGIATITDVFFDNIQIKSTSAQEKDLIVPTFVGTEEKTLYVNSKIEFNPLQGVKAYDNVDGELTNRIDYTIYENNQKVDKIDLSKIGNYLIVYTVSDNANNTIQKVCKIDVVEMEKDEGNLVINGDFTNGIQNWQLVTHEGGFASKEVIDGMMRITMTGINWNDNPSSPRLNNFIPFNLISGEGYKVSFDAKADETKTILVQIGQLFEMSPYWFDMKPQTRQTYTLTNELKHYEFIFVNEMFNNKKSYITFEMGVVDDDKTITNVYFDNITIEHLNYDVKDYISPAINGLSNHWFFSKEIESFDPLKGIEVIDNVDGDLTSSLIYHIYKDNSLVDGINLDSEGEYEIEYQIADKSNNETIKRIKVSILPEKEKINNLLENTSWKKNDEGVSDFVVQNIQNGVKFIMSDEGGKNTWDIRAVSNNITIINGVEYTIYFDLESTEERNIFIQVGNYDNTSYFQVQYSKVLKVSKDKSRYKIDFIANANGNFALGFEMGPGSNYSYIKADIEVTNFVMIKGNTYLSTPTGIVLNKIPQGTILAFAALYSGDVKFLLYVYDSNNLLINKAPFNITNGQNLDLLDIPSGTYTIKIQAIGTEANVIPSDLTQGYTYTK